MSKIKTLKDVRRYLNSIPDINCGGCGISALAIQEWAKKNTNMKNIRFAFLYYNKNSCSYGNNKDIISKKVNKRPEAPNHCCVLIGRRKIDSNRMVPLRFRTKLIVTKKFLIESIKNRGSWNWRFNRAYIEDIEEKLGISLASIY